MAQHNKTALVTGASRGIGRATAAALARAGAHVLVHYGRSEREAVSVVSEIETKGGLANAISADLATPNGAALLAKQVRSIVGDRLDVLVSNAGISKAATIKDHTVEDFDNLFATNVRRRRSWEARFGQRFDSCLRLDQRSIRDSRQKLGCHSWAARYSRQCSRARCDRYGYVEFYEDRRGPRGHAGDASTKANRQAGGRGGCCRVFSLGQGALDHRCQYSRRWRVEAVTNTVRSAMETKTSKGKEIRIPGPDHPIKISPAEGKVRVTVGGRIVAESTRALRLEEKGYPPVYYLPRDDADMSLLVRTKHYTYCPYKGDCTYYSIPIGGSNSEYAVWTYDKPYEAVANIKEYLAFYPSRVDAIEVIA